MRARVQVPEMRIDEALRMPFPGDAARRSVAQDRRFRRAFDDHYKGIWRFLRRLGVPEDRADDAAQQVYLITLEAMDRIVEGSEKAFLYGTAVRFAAGVRRKATRETPTGTFELDRSPLPSPDQLADQKRARDALDLLILHLGDELQTVFVLAEFEGFTTPEIAQLLELPLGTAASRLRRAREKFQLLIGQLYGVKP